jgi:hypothetical protein
MTLIELRNKLDALLNDLVHPDTRVFTAVCEAYYETEIGHIYFNTYKAGDNPYIKEGEQVILLDA